MSCSRVPSLKNRVVAASRTIAPSSPTTSATVSNTLPFTVSPSRANNMLRNTGTPSSEISSRSTPCLRACAVSKVPLRNRVVASPSDNGTSSSKNGKPVLPTLAFGAIAETSATASSHVDQPWACAPLGPTHTPIGIDELRMASSTSCIRVSSITAPREFTCNTRACAPLVDDRSTARSIPLATTPSINPVTSKTSTLASASASIGACGAVPAPKNTARLRASAANMTRQR